MIGKDLVKYHSQIHGPVHYTDALASYYGLSGNPPLPPRFEGISGDTRDGGASKQDPFQGHMFIQGCVSAIGWLNDAGECTKLAKTQRTGCRPIQICGDHMRGPLHFSHRNLTLDSSYDYRNAEVSFQLDRDTFKTVVVYSNRQWSNALHITPTNIKPGCVSTLRVYVAPTSTSPFVKITFHPDLVWLTRRPIIIMRGFEGTVSFESYGDTTENVVCAYKERCLETCPSEIGPCSAAGLSGFDSRDGHEDDPTESFGRSSTGQALTGCRPPLRFVPWYDDCGSSYSYSLTAGEERTLYYRFDDYYSGDGGTRLWDWTGEQDKITDIPEGDWYYSGPNVNYFDFNVNPTRVPDYNSPPPPHVQIFKDHTSLSARTMTPLLSTIIYDSIPGVTPDDPLITYLPVEDTYAVKFIRSGGTRYMVKIRCPDGTPLVEGNFIMTCPDLLLAHRYILK